MGTKEGPALRAPSMNFACGAGRCIAEQGEELSSLHVSHATVWRSLTTQLRCNNPNVSILLSFQPPSFCFAPSATEFESWK
jgi:hypothetical protein